MGIFNKFTPQVRQYIKLAKNRVGTLFQDARNEMDMFFQNGNLTFKINQTNVFTLTEDGMIDEVGGSFLPEQTGHTGQYLATNGVTASWETLASGGSSLPDQSGHSNQYLKSNGLSADWSAISHTELSNKGTYTHTQIDSHLTNTSNPHSVTKTQVGLENVPNVDTTNAANISSGILPVTRLGSSGVIPSTYTNATITVDDYGRVTSASNGSSGSTNGADVVAKVSLVSGANNISFGETLSSSNYVISPYCYNDSGNTVMINSITSRTTTGFSINVPTACTLDYTIQLI